MNRQVILKFVFFGIFVIVMFVLFFSNKSMELPYETTKESAIIELRFSSSWAGIDTKSDILEEIIQSFERAYPNIKIINESMSGEDYLFILKADFASGNGPDIFGLWPGSDLNMLIEEGFIADLTEVIEENESWYKSFDERAFAAIDQENGIYSIPFEIIYEGLFLNLDLFEENHVKIPTTFEELLTAIKMFKAVNITPIAYNSTPEGSFIYQNIVASLGTKEMTENPIVHHEIQSSYLEGMNYMKELYDVGAFPVNAFTLDDYSRNQMFIEKKAAMIVQGSWFVSDALGEQVGLIPFPIDNHIKNVVYGIGNGNFHVNQQTFEDQDKKEAAILFLKYLTSESSRQKFSELPGFITSDHSNSESYLKQLGYNLINAADFLVGPPDHYINRNWWESVLIHDFPNLLEGKITPESIFESIEE
ncbi:MAG: extracellular solute-binding protein [Clostridia bacterium]|nr:extracellular solute-binding protein [Clostridia bacterium]